MPPLGDTANNFSIKIINNSNKETAYILYQIPPVESDGASVQVFTNVIAVSPVIQKGHRTTFDIQKQFYAICGTAVEPGSGSKMTITDFRKVKVAEPGAPGTKLRLTTINQEGKDPVFDNTVALTTDRQSYFEIAGDNSFSNPKDGICVGLGALDPHDPASVVAAASIFALKNESSWFAPTNGYYIEAGNSRPGSLVSTQAQKSQKVDFRQGLPDQVFSNNAQGGWDQVK